MTKEKRMMRYRRRLRLREEEEEREGADALEGRSPVIRG
jgi:hypothetical protein